MKDLTRQSKEVSTEYSVEILMFVSEEYTPTTGTFQKENPFMCGYHLKNDIQVTLSTDYLSFVINVNYYSLRCKNYTSLGLLFFLVTRTNQSSNKLTERCKT